MAIAEPAIHRHRLPSTLDCVIAPGDAGGPQARSGCLECPSALERVLVDRDGQGMFGPLLGVGIEIVEVPEPAQRTAQLEEPIRIVLAEPRQRRAQVGEVEDQSLGDPATVLGLRLLPRGLGPIEVELGVAS